MGHNIYVHVRERVQRERKKGGINYYPRDQVHQNNYMLTFNHIIQTDNNKTIVRFRCIKAAPARLRPHLGSQHTNVHPGRSPLIPPLLTRLPFRLYCADIKWSHGRASQSSQINDCELTECHSTVGGRTHRTHSCVQKQLDGEERN